MIRERLTPGCYLQEDDAPEAHLVAEGVVCARCYGALADRAAALEGALRALIAEVEKQIKATGVNGAVVNACRNASVLLAESTPKSQED